MKTQEILKVLELVKPGIASKDIIESLTYFYFTGKEVIAYNDQIAISHELETPFKTFIKAKDLLSIISRLSSEDIEFKQKESSLQIKSGKFTGTIATITDDFFVKKVKTINKSIKKTKFKKLPTNFAECLKLCQYTASTNETDGTLTCINVDGDSMIAADGKRLSYAKLSEKSPYQYFLKASIVPKLLNIHATEVGLGKSWIHYRNEDGCIFSVREIHGDYPPTEELLKVKGETIKLPSELLEGIDLLTVFADDDNPWLEIKIEKNKCSLHVTNEKGKASYKSRKIKYKGEPIILRINPEFLHSMMEHTTKMTIGENLVLVEVEDFKMLSTVMK